MLRAAEVLYIFALNRTNAYCYTDSLMESTYFLSPHSSSWVPLFNNDVQPQRVTLLNLTEAYSSQFLNFMSRLNPFSTLRSYISGTLNAGFVVYYKE